MTDCNGQCEAARLALAEVDKLRAEVAYLRGIIGDDGGCLVFPDFRLSAEARVEPMASLNKEAVIDAVLSAMLDGHRFGRRLIRREYAPVYTWAAGDKDTKE